MLKEEENNTQTDSATNEQSQDLPSSKESKDQPSSQKAVMLPIEKLEMRLLRQLDACTLCGECLKWCPVYEQDSQDDLVPREKIMDFLAILKSQHSLISRLLRPGKKDSALKQYLRKIFRIRDITEEDLNKFARNLYKCSTCGQCAVVCPAGINTVDLWENIRQLLVVAGYGPMDNHMALVKSVKSYDNPWQQPRQGRTKWARSAKKKNLLIDTPRDIKKTQGNVLLYLGCTAVYDMNVNQVAINTVNILEALDINYGCLGGAEKCCGSVLLRVGDPEFYRLARENIQEFNKLNIDTLVTSCAGCFKTIKQDYPKVGELNFQVLHTVEFLERLRQEGKLTFPHRVERKVTYHDPCHLGRATGVFDAPRKIMYAIPGLELIEMPRHDEYSRCCGAGGGVKAGFPDLQEKMALARVKEAEETGAQELISACPFCFAGLQVGIKAMRSHLVMKDVTSLVAEALLGQAAEDKDTRSATKTSETKKKSSNKESEAKEEKETSN